MATSGTADFNMDFTEIADLAWMQAGREMRTGFDLRIARQSMNLLTIDWQNKGLNMWTFDEGSISLVAGTAEYDLPADTIDLLEHTIRTGSGNTQTDIGMTRISVSVYATIPNKNATGKPLQIFIQRSRVNPTVTVWPVPDASQPYTLRYWRMRRIEDAGDGVNTPDVQFRFLPALVAGLAYYISMKVPELMPRMDMLKAVYEEAYANAAAEDREKASIRLIPAMR